MKKKFSEAKINDLSIKLFEEAQKAAHEGDMGKAAEFYFYAAEGQYLTGDRLFSAKLHCLSFLSQIQDERYLRDKLNLKYLGRFEEILEHKKRYDMMLEYYKQINSILRKSRHFKIASQFYIREMRIRKKIFKKERRFIMYGLYRLWEISSLFGESALRLLLCILALSLVQTLILLPAPNEAFAIIRVIADDFQNQSFFDYWYLSLSILFSWNWKVLQPVNIFGFILIIFRFIMSLAIVTLFVNVLIRKMSPR